MNAAPPATGLVPVAGGAFVVSGEGRQGALGGALGEGHLPGVTVRTIYATARTGGAPHIPPPAPAWEALSGRAAGSRT